MKILESTADIRRVRVVHMSSPMHRNKPKQANAAYLSPHRLWFLLFTTERTCRLKVLPRKLESSSASLTEQHFSGWDDGDFPAGVTTFLPLDTLINPCRWSKPQHPPPVIIRPTPASIVPLCHVSPGVSQGWVYWCNLGTPTPPLSHQTFP